MIFSVVWQFVLDEVLLRVLLSALTLGAVFYGFVRLFVFARLRFLFDTRCYENLYLSACNMVVLSVSLSTSMTWVLIGYSLVFQLAVQALVLSYLSTRWKALDRAFLYVLTWVFVVGLYLIPIGVYNWAIFAIFFFSAGFALNNGVKIIQNHRLRQANLRTVLAGKTPFFTRAEQFQAFEELQLIPIRDVLLYLKLFVVSERERAFSVYLYGDYWAQQRVGNLACDLVVGLENNEVVLLYNRLVLVRGAVTVRANKRKKRIRQRADAEEITIGDQGCRISFCNKTDWQTFLEQVRG
jgi:hypothetical protein